MIKLYPHGIINYSRQLTIYYLITISFFLNYEALPATFNGEEPSAQE
ncbi:MAG: hypothetical protein QW837_05275 [Conexivisphaerales archaeon]